MTFIETILSCQSARKEVEGDATVHVVARIHHLAYLSFAKVGILAGAAIWPRVGRTDPLAVIQSFTMDGHIRQFNCLMPTEQNTPTEQC